MLRCAVVGATGYTGIELIKILLTHPRAKLTALTTRQKESIPVRDLAPQLPSSVDLHIRSYSNEEILAVSDVVFLCLPHTEAAEAGAFFYRAGKIVIDLSADYRLKKSSLYPRWYGEKHPVPELLKKAVYGLPEWNRAQIRGARLIANPGCYPTASILGAAPLLKAGLIETGSLIIDAKSGASGAGKKLTAATQFCEVDENFYAYKAGRHQHTPEIEQALSAAAGKSVAVTFVPHLLALKRGILCTIYATLKKKVRPEAVAKAFEKAYAGEPFVRLKPAGRFPALADVQHTNYCDIGWTLAGGPGRVIVVSAIDNLVKGASGQAVQNFNVCFGFSEREGLERW